MKEHLAPGHQGQEFKCAEEVIESMKIVSKWSVHRSTIEVRLQATVQTQFKEAGWNLDPQLTEEEHPGVGE